MEERQANLTYEKGEILIAIDPCTMHDDGVDALEVGKEYVVVNTENPRYIVVLDEQGDVHDFSDEYGEPIEMFFKKKEEE